MFKTFFLQYLFGGLISLITITNPLSKIPMFVTLTAGMSDLRRNHQAKMAAVYAGSIMAVSLLAGNVILSVFGISYGALRIAGGFVVAVLGYRMLFLSQDPGQAPKPSNNREDYAFFPLAMPGISGPGTIAVVIGIATEIAEEHSLATKALAFGMTFTAIFLTSLGMWFVLRFSALLSEKMGRNGTEVMTRLLGFLLICVGVQFIGSGIRSFMAGS
ncbi:MULTISPECIES: MarC family NAAT transporter [unclassified Paludibacterium]|uniref:MarC family NAAT transporter n=1 Tax=unclassified Paludibacterium TaxID=2618429 RepID=UPI001C05ABD7|nr:MarC family NAAT transporter [Paludibacterium sp. B53371]BEV72523.1 NAAT family transporter MarC [Paludibacterium sp. THUN1379]